MTHPARHCMTQCSIRLRMPVRRSAPARSWRLVAPWLGYVFLAAAAVLGLFTASGARRRRHLCDRAWHSSSSPSSLIAVRMKRQFDGREVGFLLPVSLGQAPIRCSSSIAVLAVLGLVGLILAATVGGTLYGIGLALFIVAAAFIFGDIKRYFDRRDGGG